MDRNGGGLILFSDFCAWYLDVKALTDVIALEDSDAEEMQQASSKLSDIRDDLSPEFDRIDRELLAILADRQKTQELWESVDENGNNIASLAEIDRMIVSRYPILDCKPALIRAFFRTTSVEGGGDGDDWVSRQEFSLLVQHILLFNRIFKVFNEMDSGKDRRVRSTH